MQWALQLMGSALLLTAVTAREPGFKVRITNNSFPLLGEFTKKSLERVLSSKDEHRIDGSMGSVDFHLYKLRVTDFDHSFLTKFDISAGKGLDLEISDLTMRFGTPYKVELWIFYNTGKVTVDLYKSRIKARLALNERDGKLNPVLQTCDTAIPIVTVKFHGGMINQIMNLFKGKIARAVKGILQKRICDFLSKSFTAELKDALIHVPLAERLFDNFYIDYAMTGPPEITHNLIESRHNGDIYAINTTGPANGPKKKLEDRSAPYIYEGFPTALPTNGSKMAYLYLSNYTLNSLLYYLYRYHSLDFDFTRGTLPPEMAEYLKINCDFICAGTLFPTLAQNYPNGTIEVFARLAKPPFAVLRDKMIDVMSHVNFTGYVRQSAADSDLIFVFTGMVDAQAILENFGFHTGSIKGDIRFERADLRDVRSTSPDVDRKSLEFVISYVMQDFVQPHLVRLISTGIKFPEPGPFKLTSSEIKLAKDVVVFESDFDLK